jgi:5'-nucleotidase/UDP-sugar diphosphatase
MAKQGTIGAISAVMVMVTGALACHAPRRAPRVTSDRALAVQMGEIVRGRCDRDSEHFTLAHFNDLQAHYVDIAPGKNRYGYIAGYLRALRQEEPNTLIVDAGDDYEKGSIVGLRSMGESTRRMTQALPLDVRTIGNHDFAYGEAALLRDVQLSTHPVLAANVHYSDGSSPFLPYVAATVGCVRVGVVGLVTTSYGSDDQPSDRGYFGVLEHDDHYVKVLRDVVARHRGEVDVMIALTHLGFYTDLDLGTQVPDVDVVVGGHSEDLLQNGQAYQRRDGRTGWVLQAGHFGEHIGRADFTFDRASHTLKMSRYSMIDVDTSLPYADDVGRTAHALEKTFATDTRTPIAVVGAPIESGEPMVRLLARAVRDRWAVDALLVGRDVFWQGLPAGPVSLQRLFESVPVQREPSGTPGYTSLYIVPVTGADLLALRQHAFGGYSVELPEGIVADRTYRLALDKRALEHTASVVAGVSLPSDEARFGGEIIDVLEAYARKCTARGVSL